MLRSGQRTDYWPPNPRMQPIGCARDEGLQLMRIFV
jgi:hypothetical protein